MKERERVFQIGGNESPHAHSTIVLKEKLMKWSLYWGEKNGTNLVKHKGKRRQQRKNKKRAIVVVVHKVGIIERRGFFWWCKTCFSEVSTWGYFTYHSLIMCSNGK
jgi:hypothetical protein